MTIYKFISQNTYNHIRILKQEENIMLEGYEQNGEFIQTNKWVKQQ